MIGDHRIWTPREHAAWESQPLVAPRPARRVPLAVLCGAWFLAGAVATGGLGLLLG